MKHIIEFDLSQDNENCFEEERKLKQIIHAEDMQVFIWDVFQTFRNEMKYNEHLTEAEYKILDKVKKELSDNLRDRNLEFILEG